MARGFNTNYSGTGGGGNFGYTRFETPSAAGFGGQQLAEGFGALSRALAQRQGEEELKRRQAINYWRQNTKHIPQKKLAEFEGAFDAGVDERVRNSAEHIYARAQNSIKAWDDTRAAAAAAAKQAEEEQKAAEARQKAAEKQAADLRKLTGKGQAEAVAERARVEAERAKYDAALEKYNAARAKARRAAAARGELSSFSFADFAGIEPSVQQKVVPVHERPEDVGLADAIQYVSIPRTDPRVWLTPDEAAQFAASEGAQAQPAAAGAIAPPRQPAVAQPPAGPQPAAGPSAPAPQPPTAPEQRDPRLPPFAAPRTPEQIEANYFHGEAVDAADKAVEDAEKDTWSRDAVKLYAEDVLQEYSVWRAEQGMQPMLPEEEKLIRSRFETDARRYLAGPQRGQQVFANTTDAETGATFQSTLPFGYSTEDRNRIAAKAWDRRAGEYPGLYVDEEPLRPAYQPPEPRPEPGADERPWYRRPGFGLGESIAGAYRATPGGGIELFGVPVYGGGGGSAQELASQSMIGAVSPETLPPTAEETFGQGFFPGMDALEATMVRTEEVTPEEQAQFEELRQQKEQMTSLARFVGEQALQQRKTQDEARSDIETALTRQMASLQQQIASGRTALAAPANQRIAQATAELTTPANAAKIAGQAIVMMTVGRFVPGAPGAALGAGLGTAATETAERALRGQPISPSEIAQQAALEGATVGLASKIPMRGLERGLERGLTRTVGRVSPGGVGRVLVGAGREAIQETTEEAIQQVMQGEFNPENLAVAAIGGGLYGPAFESVLVGMGVDADAATEAAQRQREAVQQVLEGEVLPPDSPQAQTALAVIEGQAPPEGAGPSGPAGQPALPPGPTPAGLISPGTVRTPEGAIVGEPGAEPAGALPAGETELQRLQREVAEAMQRSEQAQALPTRRGPRTGGGLDIAGPEAIVEPGLTTGGMEQSPGGLFLPSVPTSARITSAMPAGALGGRAPTEVQGPSPEAFPGMGLQPTTVPFREWVDGQYGDGTFDAAMQQWQETGDREGLDTMQRAYQIARGKAESGGQELPQTRQEAEAALASAQAARALGAMGRGEPDVMNRLRQEARAAEALARGGAAIQGPVRTQAETGRVYQTTEGSDGMFYVDALQDPRQTRREREGEGVQGLPYRQQVVGPFTTREAAEAASDAMQARYDVEAQDLSPAQLLREERKWATAAWREGVDRGARRQAGRGRPSPATLAPGVAEAQAAAEAAPAEPAAQPAPARRGGRLRQLAEQGGGAPPSRRGVLPSARRQAGTAGPTIFRSRTEALKARQKQQQAADEVDVPSAEIGQQEEAALIDEMRAAADMMGPQALADALGITVEEATQYIAAQRTLKGGGMAMGAADPFSLAVGTAQELLKRRKAQRKATEIERKAARQRRKALREGQGEATQAGTLQSRQEALQWGEDYWNETGSLIDGGIQRGEYDVQEGSVPTVEIVWGAREKSKGGGRDAFLQWIAEEPLDEFDERQILHDPDITEEGRRVARAQLWQDWQREQKEATGKGTPPIAIQSPYFMLTTKPDGRVEGMAIRPEALGNDKLKFRASADMMRVMTEAIRHDLRFERLENISGFTARLYDNIASMWGGKGSDLADKTIADVVENTPDLKRAYDSFALREQARQARKAGAQATASFMGLDQAWDIAKGWFPGDAATYVKRAAIGPRSVLEYMRDLGPRGQQIASMQEQYRDIFESMRGQWFFKTQNALRDLGDAEKASLVDWLEDSTKPVSAKVRQRGEQLRTVLNQVADLAQQNERFSQYVTDYFPHMLSTQPDFQQKARSAAAELWKSPTHKARMQAMGATNWSDNIAADYAAAQMMFPGGRLYGGKNPNLEKHRTGFMAEYRKDPEVLYLYLNSAAKAISQAMVYDSPKLVPQPGLENDRYGRWKMLWGQLANEPGMDRGTVEGLKTALERELGIEQPPPSTQQEQIAAVRDIVASSSLFLSVLAQPGSFADLRASMGSLEIPEAAFAGFRQAFSRKAIDAAVRAGSVSPKGLDVARSFAEERALGSQSGRTATTALGKAAQKYRNAPWMRAMRSVDSAMRVTADSAARIALPKLILQIRSGHKPTLGLLADAGVNVDALRRLSPDQIMAAARLDSLDANAQQTVDQYARRWTEFTQQRARPGDLPKSWSGPIGQWVSMFMPFTYRQTKNMLKAFQRNPVGFMRSGLPAYTFVGFLSATMRAVASGYGMGGEENDEMDLADKLSAMFSNRPIRPDSPEDMAARIAQTVLRVGPKPFGMYLWEKVERAKDAGDIAGSAAGPGSRLFQAGESALRGIRQHDRPSNVSPAEWAMRAAAVTGAQLALPSTYSYQIQRELMGQQTDFPRREISLPPSPGAVGRTLDLMRGEITPAQWLGGVTYGGEGNLSQRRRERRARIKASRARTPRAAAEAYAASQRYK